MSKKLIGSPSSEFHHNPMTIKTKQNAKTTPIQNDYKYSEEATISGFVMPCTLPHVGDPFVAKIPRRRRASLTISKIRTEG
jgi:hypothetical protein